MLIAIVSEYYGILTVGDICKLQILLRAMDQCLSARHTIANRRKTTRVDDGTNASRKNETFPEAGK